MNRLFLFLAVLSAFAVGLYSEPFVLTDVEDRNLNVALQALGKVDLNTITNLELSSSKLSDISPLGKLPQLIRLQLFNNQLDDISSLSNLVNLEVLSIARNQISNIDVLSNMPNLASVYLDKNPIRSVMVLKDMKKLKDLSLGGMFIDVPSFENWAFDSNLVITERTGKSIKIKADDKKKWGLKLGIVVPAWAE